MESLSLPTVRNVCFIGAGYVGGPTAAVIALHNRAVRVTVVDNDEARIRRWQSQHPPVYEPGLQEILRITRDGTNTFQFNQNPQGTPADNISHLNVERLPNLFFSSEVEKTIWQADIVFICVSTPTKMEGEGAGSATDLSSFEKVAALAASHGRPGVIIVDKSTVPCGTADTMEKAIKRALPGLNFDVLSNPEFLAAGTAIQDLLNPARVLIGSSKSGAGQRASQILASLYNWVPKDKIITTDYFSSELAKLVANAMLAQRVSSINSVAAICDEAGADVDEVAKAIGADERIGRHYLRAGIGFGGSCFKKDVLSLVYLANTLELPVVANYWLSVLEMNRYAKNRLLMRLRAGLDDLVTGKKITVLGYAFKNKTNDARESPVHDIIRGLAFRKPAEIAIFDPCCAAEDIEHDIDHFHGIGMATSENGRVSVYRDAQSACRGAHAIVITTEFNDFEYGTSEDAECVPETTLVDPRPFPGGWPTEAEMLALHYYLVQSPDEPMVAPQTKEDPLGQFNPMPLCEENCPDCQAAKNKTEKEEKPEDKDDIENEYNTETKDTIPNQKLNWKEVHADMQEPHLVFDGRGVLDIAKMENMGFEVMTVGRQSRAQWREMRPGSAYSWI